MLKPAAECDKFMSSLIARVLKNHTEASSRKPLQALTSLGVGGNLNTEIATIHNLNHHDQSTSNSKQCKQQDKIPCRSPAALTFYMSFAEGRGLLVDSRQKRSPILHKHPVSLHTHMILSQDSSLQYLSQHHHFPQSSFCFADFADESSQSFQLS